MTQGRGDGTVKEARERERVERFLTAFNAVDRLLRERTGVDDHGVPFRTVLRRFLRSQPWRGAERLTEYAELRNLLVHETLAPDAYLAVPSEEVVRRLEEIRDRLAGEGADVAAAVAAATAADVLGAEADRQTWATAAADEPAERVLARFVDAPELEAVLITRDSSDRGPLLGIATHLGVVRRWDPG